VALNPKLAVKVAQGESSRTVSRTWVKWFKPRWCVEGRSSTSSTACGDDLRSGSYPAMVLWCGPLLSRGWFWEDFVGVYFIVYVVRSEHAVSLSKGTHSDHFWVIYCLHTENKCFLIPGRQSSVPPTHTAKRSESSWISIGKSSIVGHTRKALKVLKPLLVPGIASRSGCSSLIASCSTPTKSL